MNSSSRPRTAGGIYLIEATGVGVDPATAVRRLAPLVVHSGTTGLGPDCVKTRLAQIRWSGRAGAEGKIEPEWREVLASEAFLRA